MARLLHGSTSFLAWLCVAGSGCYTGPINEPPTVLSIIPPAASEIARGAPLMFRAQTHDDQAGPLAYQWGAARVACVDMDPLPAAPTAGQGTDAIFTVTFDQPGPYCVFVTVTDDFGATGSKLFGMRIDDRAPTAVIQEVGPGLALSTPRTSQPLYSSLRFTATGSNDPDSSAPLTISWSLMAPDPQPDVTPCEAGSSDFCFQALVPGTYVLTLKVTDGDGLPSTATATFTVLDDQPPCIGASGRWSEATEPSSDAMVIRDPDKELVLAVTSVVDDGDPLPAPNGQTSGATFVWSWRVGQSGPFSRRVSYAYPSYSFPAGSFQLGDTVQVRVEVGDRKDRTADLASCRAADPPVCEMPTETEPDCARWVTWTVEMIR